MRRVALGLLLLPILGIGCAVGPSIHDLARDVHDRAFADTRMPEVRWDRNRIAAYDKAQNVILLHPAWALENEEWRLGVLAHEFIHAKGIVGHGPDFQAERLRVARALGIPPDTIPDARSLSKVEVTRDVQQMDHLIQCHRDHARGLCAPPDLLDVWYPNFPVNGFPPEGGGAPDRR
jgi:hypothetical protein